MERTVQAVYEKGVLRPLDPLSLQERQQVTVTVSEAAAIPPDHPLLVPPGEWTSSGADDVTPEEVRRALSPIRGSLSQAVVEDRRER